MTEAERKARNDSMLAQCWPSFRAQMEKIIAAMEALGFRPRIQCAWRSVAEQKIAQDSGHSQLSWGFHNATGKDGVTPEALATDTLDDDAPLNPPREYLYALAREAEKVGCLTGIRWGLPTMAMRDALTQAINSDDVTRHLRIGFDPSHIQCTGITLIEAKAGKRP